MEPAGGGETERLRQLLRLVIEHNTAVGTHHASPTVSEEHATSLPDTANERLRALAAFAAQSASSGDDGPADLLALRLLLDEYAAAVNRERAVAVASHQALDRVRETIRAFRKVQKDFKIYPGAAGPPHQRKQGSPGGS